MQFSSERQRTSRRLQFWVQTQCSLTDLRYCVSISDNTVPKNCGNCGIAVLNNTVKPTVLVVPWYRATLSQTGEFLLYTHDYVDCNILVAHCWLYNTLFISLSPPGLKFGNGTAFDLSSIKTSQTYNYQQGMLSAPGAGLYTVKLGPFFFEVWLSLTSPGSFLVVF